MVGLGTSNAQRAGRRLRNDKNARANNDETSRRRSTRVNRVGSDVTDIHGSKGEDEGTAKRLSGKGDVRLVPPQFWLITFLGKFGANRAGRMSGPCEMRSGTRIRVHFHTRK